MTGWRVRTCCPCDSSAKSVTPRASWRSLTAACRLSMVDACANFASLDTGVPGSDRQIRYYLLPYNNYAGEGKRLSMGVALSTSTAI